MGVNGDGINRAPVDVKILTIKQSGEVSIAVVDITRAAMREFRSYPRIDPGLAVVGVSPWHAYVSHPPAPPDGDAYNFQATALAKGAGWMSDNVLRGSVAFFGTGPQGHDDIDVPWNLLKVGVRARLWDLAE